MPSSLAFDSVWGCSSIFGSVSAIKFYACLDYLVVEHKSIRGANDCYIPAMPSGSLSEEPGVLFLFPFPLC